MSFDQPVVSEKDLRDDINALFSLVSDTLTRLAEFLTQQKGQIPTASYRFIGSNIADTFEISAKKVKELREEILVFQRNLVLRPVILRLWSSPDAQRALYDIRDQIAENSEDIRQAAFDITTNISLAFAGYIMVYEILEKFDLTIPFILIESNAFSEAELHDRFFPEYDVAEHFLGTYIPPKPGFSLETLTYSGLEMHSPEALLLLGHECFHIVDKFLEPSSQGAAGLLAKFCQHVGAKIPEEMLVRCNEAFIDVMSSLYLGPAYIVALLNHFLRTYPASDEDHAETSSRVQLLSKVSRQLGYFDLSRVLVPDRFAEAVRRFDRHMTGEQRELAKRDFAYLDKLLELGLVGFIRDFFAKRNVKIYADFKRVWTNEEATSELDKMDQTRMLFCLAKNIPVAVRPSILLNTAVEYKEALPLLESKTITGSIKKWYVKRYYQKATELEESKSEKQV